tara:strand:+ start:382 stop:1137 length:756 start_codon:yes stop_codon:yes gene_type:complete
MNGDSKKGLSLYDLLYGNQSAEADSLQQDAIRRLQEGGLIGKQGEALVDKLTFDPSDTGPIIGQNPTTELDSLQRDAVDRLRSGGMFGKQGRRFRDWFESVDWKDIFKEMQNRGFTSVGPLRRKNENSNVEVPGKPGWTEDELNYGRMRQAEPSMSLERMQEIFPVENLIPGLGVIGKLKKLNKIRWKSGKVTDLRKPLVRKADHKRVMDADKTEIQAMQDYYKDPGLREQKMWADLTIKELLRSMRRGKK